MENKKDQVNIYRMLLPCLLGIFFCAVCLVGSSFAWFSANQTAPAEPIQSASYKVDVSIVGPEATAPLFDGQSYTLAPGSYTVTLTAGGTATNGYCVVTLGGEELYTQQFAQESIAFTVNVNANTTMKILSCWGTSIRHDNPDISGGTVLGELTGPVCTCTAPCAEGAANQDCAVCKESYASCAAAVCNCETLCAEGAVKADCPLCAGNAEGCQGTEQEPEATAPEATDPEATDPEVTVPPETTPETTTPDTVPSDTTQEDATQPPVPTTEPPATTQPEETTAAPVETEPAAAAESQPAENQETADPGQAQETAA